MISYLFLICCIFSVYISAQNGFNKTVNIEGVTESFTVPFGIYNVHFEIEGASPSTAMDGFAFSGTIPVKPLDILTLAVGHQSDKACASQASRIYLNDEEIVAAAGGSFIDVGGGFAGCLDSYCTYGNGGEGYDGECGSPSYMNANITNLAFQPNRGNGHISVRYDATCPIEYDLLHSDFSPEFLGSSSLYMENNVPKLGMDFVIPSYYVNVTMEYADCNEAPTYTKQAINSACDTEYYTIIDHADKCNFTVEVNPDDETEYYYKGTLRVSAEVYIFAEGDPIRRQVSSILNWIATMPRLISVSTDVELMQNQKHCYLESDCNDQGCCESGYCNCDCGTSTRTGYEGKYCGDDVTKPVCGPEFGQTYSFDSFHGGCILAHERGVLPSVTYTDNSGNVTLDTITIFNADTTEITVTSEELESYCFQANPINNVVKYTISDDAGNEQVCTYEVEINDVAKPMIDCHFCNAEFYNDGLSTINFCQGTQDPANPFVKVQVDANHVSNLVGDDVLKVEQAFVSQYPGQFINMNVNTDIGNLADVSKSNVWLDCDCNINNPYVTPYEIANVWNEWGIPQGYDTIDVVTTVPAVTNTGDGMYNLTYTTVDSSGNTNECEYDVLFDATPPTCTSFKVVVEVDPDNKNYSLPVTFPEPVLGIDFTISGAKSGPTLVPTAPLTSITNGDVYWVGYNFNQTYRGQYVMEDLAGNVGGCDWEVVVDNPDPCVWPVCDDVPPVIASCPTNIIINCAQDQSDCGCGNWAEPQFTDDKFVKEIKVFINDELYETYNNAPGSDSTAASQKLGLGVNEIRYTAYDMHGYNVSCIFNVTINDIHPPIIENCPESTQYNLITEPYYDYSYSFSAYDECVHTENIVWKTLDYPSAPELGSNNMPDGNSQYTPGTYDYKYIAEDAAGQTTECSWTIEVIDTGAPTITCPQDIVQRLAQGSTTTVVTYSASAVDNSDPNPDITFSIASGSAFEGPVRAAELTHQVVAIATDHAGNTDTCTFEVTILPAYPFSEVNAVMTRSHISLQDSGNFGADIEFLTISSPWHRITNAVSDNSDFTITETSSDCALDWSVCQQYHSFLVEFDTCEINDIDYPITLTSDCLPSDCAEEDQTVNIIITLSAANYCWQSLEEVEVTAILEMLDKSVHDLYSIAYDAAQDPVLGDSTYPTKYVYENQDEISGIITVTSPNAILASVAVNAVTKTQYEDSDLTTVYEAEKSIYDISTFESKQDWASFTYTEVDIPLESTSYVAYKATVAMTYNLPNSNGSRRMILDIDTSATDKSYQEVESDVIFIADSSTTIIGQDSDAEIVLGFDNCGIPSTLWNANLIGIFANYLRIQPIRLNIDVTNPDKNNKCLINMIIKQSDCTEYDIDSLLYFLEQGIIDQYSELHIAIDNDDLLTDDIILDSSIFFVKSMPSYYLNENNDVNAMSATTYIIIR